MTGNSIGSLVNGINERISGLRGSSLADTGLGSSVLGPSVLGPSVLGPSDLGRLGLSSTEVQRRAEMTANPGGFKQYLAELSEHWQQGARTQLEALSNAPDSIRPLLETQRAVNQLDLQIQIISRVADAVSSGTRRMQQMSGS